MKRRNGYVSNSSSSSFMIFFDKRPESEQDVFDAVYGGDVDYHIHTSYYEEVLHAPQAANYIYTKLGKEEEEGKLTKEGYPVYTKAEEVAMLLNTIFYAKAHSNYNTSFDSFDRVLAAYLSADDVNELTQAARDEANAYATENQYRNMRLQESYSKVKDNCDIDWEVFNARMDKDCSYVGMQAACKQNREAFNICTTKKAKKLLANVKRKGKWLGIVTFGDEHGRTEAIMEHGNAFDKIKHIKVNQH